MMTALMWLLLQTTGAEAGEAPPTPPSVTPAPTVVEEPAPVAAAEPSLDADLVAGELAALESEPKMSIYGFLDTGLQRYFGFRGGQTAIAATEESTFVSGNTNIYFDARPVEGWRALVETRFTLMPHGDYRYGALGPAQRTDTYIIDASSPSGRNRVLATSIVLERSQLEYSWSDKLSLRAGYFFTPWGIWNVDHGTPTLISLIMPSFLVLDAVPQRQTGVELYGRLHLLPFTLAYSAYVSNGRASTIFDLSDDKAIGARLVLSRRADGYVAFGLSGFHGSTKDEQRSIVIGADGVPSIAKSTNYAYTENSVGADLTLDAGAWRVRAEGVVRHVRYEPGLHERSQTMPAARLPNRYEWFGYVLVARRVFRYFEPYAYVEAIETNQRAGVTDAGRLLAGGLNIYFTPAAQLKMQYADVQMDNFTGTNGHLGYFVSRLALAF